jgi:hypothetical protein
VKLLTIKNQTMNTDMEKELDDFLEKLLETCTTTVETYNDGDDDSGSNDSRLDEF